MFANQNHCFVFSILVTRQTLFYRRDCSLEDGLIAVITKKPTNLRVNCLKEEQEEEIIVITLMMMMECFCESSFLRKSRQTEAEREKILHKSGREELFRVECEGGCGLRLEFAWVIRLSLN
jgi:hypothetical protein